MAKLPANLVTPSEPKLGDISVGEIVYVPAFGMCVTTERDCFLRPGVSIARQKTAGYPLLVRRAEDGFHVTVVGKATWSPDTPPEKIKGWMPVLQIDVRYDPTQDLDYKIEEVLRRVESRH